MNKTKIAFYYNLSFGGALNTMLEFARYLSRTYTIDLYTMEEQLEELKVSFLPQYFSSIYTYKRENKEVIKGGPLLRIQEDYNFFNNIRNLHKTIASDIDKRNYKVVVISHDKYCQTPFLIRYLKTKTVYYCQEPIRMYYEYALNPINNMPFSIKKIYLLFSDYFRKQTDIKNARSATKILSNSYSSNESIYRAYGIYPSVCHLGVDQNKFKDLRVKKENFVYAIGNLSPHKAHKFIIEAISLIPGNKRPKLIIATGGVDLVNANSLYTFAKKMQVNIKILEKISDKQHVELYNKARATICAAHLETLGLSALESMTCGTPVIAVQEGGYRDIIQNIKTGFFVNRDIKELAKMIQDLFEKKLPIKQITKEARKTIIPYWTWEQATARLERYIKTI